MMQAFRRNFLCLVIALFTGLSFAACENPFDPLDTSTEIRGLTYIEFSVDWDRWDSDPEYDGVSVAVDYFNEFGDSLEFRKKSTEFVIEFYTQIPAYIIPDPLDPDAEGTPGPLTSDKLFFSYPATVASSDDVTRIPIEAYRGALVSAGYLLTEPALAFVLLRLYPPDAYPLPELNAWLNDVTVYAPEAVVGEEEPFTLSARADLDNDTHWSVYSISKNALAISHTGGLY
jgi:hypothetical protein